MKRSIKFSITPRNQIRIRVTFSGNRVDFYTGISITKELWNETKERATPNKRTQQGIDTNNINNKLQQLELRLNSIFTRYDLENKELTADLLRSEFEQKTTQQNNYFNSLLETFILEQSKLNSWAIGTAKSFNALKNRINNYKQNPHIKTVDSVQFLKEFTIFLHDQNYQNTTVNKTLKLLRWFLKWCERNKYIDGNFESFVQKAKTTEKAVIFLTWDELMLLYNFEFSLTWQINIRDVFCFCCFSGLRYSDVKKLRKTDIYEDKIHTVTQKTAESLTIELNNFSRAILEKYETNESEFALPVISNQKYNDEIKLVCRLAGIDAPQKETFYIGQERREIVLPKYECITTHTARKTFVVNALSLGIPSEVIMKWTGHKNFESMKPYVAIVDKLKEDEMEKFNK